jgi:hypothetical protein
MPFGDSANAKESAAKGRKKGGETTKAKAKNTLLPSQTFDWDKALRLHRKTILEIYGPAKQEEEETA